MKKIEHYWIESSDDAIDTAVTLFNNKKYHHSMFFLHLSIEKLLKALYVNKTKEEAPIGHNLPNLALKIKNIKFNKKHLELFSEITTFNIASRYDDYKRNFYKICNQKFANSYLIKGQELLKWLKSKMI